jgi:hypothetical protein
VSPLSGSVVERFPTAVPEGLFSATELLESAMSVGAVFGGGSVVNDQVLGWLSGVVASWSRALPERS